MAKNGVRVLVVEPEDGWRSHHNVTLEGLGFNVVGLASSPEEAVKVAAQTKPHVVVTCLDMPKPSATYAMMTAICHEIGQQVDFVIIDLDDPVRSFRKQDYSPEVLRDAMYRRR